MVFAIGIWGKLASGSAPATVPFVALVDMAAGDTRVISEWWRDTEDVSWLPGRR